MRQPNPEVTMLGIGNMLWRIGELLDIDQQLGWTRSAGFDGVGLHASAGVPGQWRGIEPASCDATERARLRRELSGFTFAEVHAPFAIALSARTLSADLAALEPVLELARDLGAGLVTVHAQLVQGQAPAEDLLWESAMRGLAARAEQCQTKVALEISQGFGLVKGWGLSSLGVTLDVGHMHLPANRAALLEMGGIEGLIRHLGNTLFHLHLHDVRDDIDHIEIGTGMVAFDELAAALLESRYSYGATLELNPDRASPDGIRRSAERVRRFLEKAGTE